MEVMEPRRRAIKHWAPEDRPRERMMEHQPGALSQIELLAILIRQGSRKYSAMELARHLLDRCGNRLQDLHKYSVGELMKIPGIGKAKATTIVAALELGRRVQVEGPPERHFIRNSKESSDYARPRLAHLSQEQFAVMYLTQAGWVKAFDMASKGGISSTTVDARLILKRALLESATSIIVFHNHPSGGLRPSKADEVMTQKLDQAARIMDIKLLDHVILSDSGYFSFADNGLLG